MLDEVFGQLKSRLEEELRKIVDKGDISARELENATKAVCLLEKLEDVEKTDDGYSGRSYRRGRNQNNGQYMSRDDEYSGRRYYDGHAGRGSRDGRGYYDEGKSGHSTKDRMIAKLEHMMDEETGDYERGIIQKWISRLED